jgi:hypothetical protein
MTLTYQATLDDIAEPTFRLLLRRKTTSHHRAWSSLFGAAMMALAVFVIVRRRSPEFLVTAALIAAILGAAFNYWKFIPSVKRRMKKYLQTEHGHRIPNETTYVIRPGLLRCESLGVAHEFSLADLQNISEDPGWMEISFGEKGICTIPLRAFGSGVSKEEFLQAIEANKVAVI